MWSAAVVPTCPPIAGPLSQRSEFPGALPLSSPPGSWKVMGRERQSGHPALQSKSSVTSYVAQGGPFALLALVPIFKRRKLQYGPNELLGSSNPILSIKFKKMRGGGCKPQSAVPKLGESGSEAPTWGLLSTLLPTPTSCQEGFSRVGPKSFWLRDFLR